MNFVILSYFRLNSSSIVHLELREFLRNSSRVPFSHTPSPFPSPPLPHLPSWKSMPEARRGPRNHRVRVPIFQYRLPGARTPRKFGRSISGKWTGFRLETRNIASTQGRVENNRRISNLPALSQDDIWDDVL